MPSELKEIVQDSNAGVAQHFLPDLHKLGLRKVTRGYVFDARLQATLRLRQRFAVHFAVRRQRHALQLHEIRRDHVSRHSLCQRGSHFADCQHPVCNKVGNKCLLSFVVLTGEHHRFFHALHVQKLRLDFVQLNPVPADFDLMVDPAEVFNVAVR